MAYDLARNLISDFEIANIWTGAGKLEFYESDFEELALLRPLEILGGFRCALAFSITGAEIRPSAKE